MSRRSFAHIAALTASALFATFIAVAAGPQERAASPTRPVEKAGPVPPPPPPNDSDTRSVTGPEAAVTAVINKMVNAYDLKPQPLPSIPDDPPPHEGALIDLPYVVEPPDLILVEVLEALPGRPISGERLIRADGKISLGFYGEVHVRGLTLPQVKVAIIKQIRKFISDDTLGLKDLVMLETTPAKPRNPGPLVLPPDGNPLDDADRGQPAPSPANPNASLDGPTFRAASFATISGAAPIHFVKGLGSVQEGKENEKKAPEEEKEKKAPEKAPNPIVIPFPGQGQVKITIEVQGQNAGVLLPSLPQKPEEVQVPPPESEGEQTWKIIPPQDSSASSST